jgi:hypothetical protein
MSMMWLLLVALALTGVFVLTLLFSVLGFVWFVVSLPFRLIGFLLHVPFMIFGLAVLAVVISLLVFLPLAFLLSPALLVIALAYGIWRLAHRRGRNQATA